jgi:hypothetical protein
MSAPSVIPSSRYGNVSLKKDHAPLAAVLTRSRWRVARVVWLEHDEHDVVPPSVVTVRPFAVIVASLTRWSRSKLSTTIPPTTAATSAEDEVDRRHLDAEQSQQQDCGDLVDHGRRQQKRERQPERCAGAEQPREHRDGRTRTERRDGAQPRGGDVAAPTVSLLERRLDPLRRQVLLDESHEERRPDEQRDENRHQVEKVVPGVEQRRPDTGRDHRSLPSAAARSSSWRLAVSAIR